MSVLVERAMPPATTATATTIPATSAPNQEVGLATDAGPTTDTGPTSDDGLTTDASDTGLITNTPGPTTDTGLTTDTSLTTDAGLSSDTGLTTKAPIKNSQTTAPTTEDVQLITTIPSNVLVRGESVCIYTYRHSQYFN